MGACCACRAGVLSFHTSRKVPLMSSEKVYAGSIDLSVANNSHTKIVERILEDGDVRGKRVLDIGCSQGYLGQSLRAFGLEVWGIEPSAQAAEVAATRIDQVFNCSLEAFFTLHGPLAGRFDYLIFGDVLEHLTDPGETLDQCHRLLLPDGAVIASIPNIAHLAARLMLLQGRWDYADFGLMDQTHLRFFTRSSIVALFTRSAYQVESMDRVELPVASTGIDIAPALVTWARSFVCDADADTFQYVVLARNQAGALSPAAIAANARFSSNACVRILVLVPYFDFGLATIRMVQPLSAWMRRHGGQVRFMKFADLQVADLQGIDMVVVQRVISPLALKLIRRMQGRGIRVVFDIDDLLTDIPDHLASSTALRRLRPLLEDILRSVDGVTVATQRLGDRLAPYNQCHLAPNCPAPLLTPTSNQPGTGPVTLIMASSDSVRFDFIVPALRQLMAQHAERLHLVSIGPPGDFLLSQGLAVEARPTMDYLGFRSFLASQKDAIGIIPLDDSVFGSCKSAIKFMDYALAGIPSVCSAVAPYSDVVRDGESGLLADNNDTSWHDAIERLLTSPELRATLADSARREVQANWSLTHAAQAWQAVVSAQLGDTRSAQTQDVSLPRPDRNFRLTHYWRRLRALFWAVDMEGGWLAFLRRIGHLWRTEGAPGLRRRLGAFRSRVH